MLQPANRYRYERHRPQETPLYRIVETHYPEFLARLQADGGSIHFHMLFIDGVYTALICVEGIPMGLIANNPGHLSGAIDSEGADKGARFMQLCDAFDLPILSLCDCPGIMVGPESEKTALVRHAGRMFVVGANIDVPLMTIVIRKAYGLGAPAMAGGSFKAPLFAVSWPTGEFGGMGLEGAARFGFRKELQAIDDPQERKEAYEKIVAGIELPAGEVGIIYFGQETTSAIITMRRRRLRPSIRCTRVGRPLAMLAM